MTMQDLLKLAVERTLDNELARRHWPMSKEQEERLIDDYRLIQSMFGTSYRCHPYRWSRSRQLGGEFTMRVARLGLVCEHMIKILCDNSN